MTPTVSAMWQSPPADAAKMLADCLDEALFGVSESVPVFFRADDIAAPSRGFSRLAGIFIAQGVPLCAAVVPAWLTRQRWEALQKTVSPAPELFCWHQHGWRHANHERKGKKQEFGDGRPAVLVEADLLSGKRRLETVMGRFFFPVFTPPWNRCGQATLSAMAENGYRACSRSASASPQPPGNLPDIAVNVDLHTMKGTKPSDGWKRLTMDLKKGIASGLCGIMIHHRRMNDAAFDFLEIMISHMKGREEIAITDFRSMV